MPNFDKTGPLGDGTPGRGQGECTRTPNPNFRREPGTGKGRGRRCGGRGQGLGRGLRQGLRRCCNLRSFNTSKAEEKEILQEDLKSYEQEIESIKQRLKELD